MRDERRDETYDFELDCHLVKREERERPRKCLMM